MQVIERESPNFNELLMQALALLESQQLTEIPIAAKLALLQATQVLLSAGNINADANLLLQVVWKVAAINPYDDFVQTCLTCPEINNVPEFVELKNKIALVCNSQGNLLYQQGQFEQAALHYQKALKVGENLAVQDWIGICFNAGMAWFIQGRPEQAALFFQKTLEVSPNFVQGQQMLARTHYQLETQQAGYQFSQDWFSRNLAIWQENLSFLSHQPNLNLLEIGSWEGRSTCWLLSHILTHPTSQMICIDTFEGGGGTYFEAGDRQESIEARFDHNITLAGGAEKVTKLVESSHLALRMLAPHSFDLIYIDGSHFACDVLEDTLLSWRLLKVNGLMIFDDYDHVFRESPNQNTRIGIDAFLSAFCTKVQILHQSHQVIVKKIAE